MNDLDVSSEVAHCGVCLPAHFASKSVRIGLRIRRIAHGSLWKIPIFLEKNIYAYPHASLNEQLAETPFQISEGRVYKFVCVPDIS